MINASYIVFLILMGLGFLTFGIVGALRIISAKDKKVRNSGLIRTLIGLIYVVAFVLALVFKETITALPWWAVGLGCVAGALPILLAGQKRGLR